MSILNTNQGMIVQPASPTRLTLDSSQAVVDSNKTVRPDSLESILNTALPPGELYNSLMKGKFWEIKGELMQAVFLLQYEASYQAANELNLSDNEVFLLNNNWDNYQNGGQMMDYYGNPHSRSDDILAWLDSCPEQMAEIAGLVDKLEGMEDVNNWLEESGNSWEAQRGRSPAGDISNHPIFQDMGQQLEQYAQTRENAQQRSSAAQQALGRYYGPQIA